MHESKIFPEIKNPEVMEDAIDRYGAPAQIDMAIEEMSELTKALLKNRRNFARATVNEGERLREAIIEEAATTNSTNTGLAEWIRTGMQSRLSRRPSWCPIRPMPEKEGE